MSRLPLRLLFSVVLVLATCGAMAQTAAQYIARGDKELFDGFPQSALFYYKKALAIDTYSLDGHFKTAEAYRRMRNYKRAAEHYGAANDADEKSKYPEALFWLGKMQKHQGLYKEAKRSFQYFLSSYKQRDELYRAARDEEAGCDWALDHVNDEPLLDVKAAEGINSSHSELSPHAIDSATLYFSTVHYASEASAKPEPHFISVQKAVQVDSVWTKQPAETVFVDSERHVGNAVFTADGKRVFFSKCETLESCKIWTSELVNGQWTTASALPEPINESGFTSSQPCFIKMSDGEWLIFSTNREGGKGGMDLWMVEFKKGAPTSRIRNLGNAVNTKGDEITPFYSVTDSTLYFSSNRHPGFGGFDIFKSKAVPGNFNSIENMGTEVNSSTDDYYFSFEKGRGFFASNRISGTKGDDNETCCNDVYQVKKIIEPKVVVEEVVVDTLVAADTIAESVEVPETLEELQDLLPISLFFHNDRPNPRSVATVTNRTYVQTILEYQNLENEYLNAIMASTIEPEQKKTLYANTREFFSRELPNSVEHLENALDVLLRELESGRSIELAVKGYASPLAKSDYNLNLTYRRINSMENFFRDYRDGAFVPYLDSLATNGAKLTIVKIPYGETQSASGATDRADDAVGSIYGQEARFERRIEIQRVERK